MTRTEAEYAAVLADLLIEARGDGVDVAAVIVAAIGEGPTATAEVGALSDRCRERLWPMLTIRIDPTRGESLLSNRDGTPITVPSPACRGSGCMHWVDERGWLQSRHDESCPDTYPRQAE